MVLINLDSIMDDGGNNNINIDHDNNSSNSNTKYQRRLAPSLRKSSSSSVSSGSSTGSDGNNGSSKKKSKNKKKKLIKQRVGSQVCVMCHNSSSSCHCHNFRSSSSSVSKSVSHVLKIDSNSCNDASNHTLPTITEVASDIGSSIASFNMCISSNNSNVVQPTSSSSDESDYEVVNFHDDDNDNDDDYRINDKDYMDVYSYYDEEDQNMNAANDNNNNNHNKGQKQIQKEIMKINNNEEASSLPSYVFSDHNNNYKPNPLSLISQQSMNIVIPRQEPIVVYPMSSLEAQRNPPPPLTSRGSSSIAIITTTSSTTTTTSVVNANDHFISSIVRPNVISRTNSSTTNSTSSTSGPPAICFHNDMFASHHDSHYNDADDLNQSDYTHDDVYNNDSNNNTPNDIDNPYDFHDYTMHPYHTDYNSNNDLEYYRERSLDDIDLNNPSSPANGSSNNTTLSDNNNTSKRISIRQTFGLFRPKSNTTKSMASLKDQAHNNDDTNSCSTNSIQISSSKQQHRKRMIMLLCNRKCIFMSLMIIGIIMICSSLLWSTITSKFNNSLNINQNNNANNNEDNAVSTTSTPATITNTSIIIPHTSTWYINAGANGIYNRTHTWITDVSYIVSSKVVNESRIYASCNVDDDANDISTTTSSDNGDVNNDNGYITWDHHLFCNERYFTKDGNHNTVSIANSYDLINNMNDNNPNIVSYQIPLELLTSATSITTTDNTDTSTTTTTYYNPMSTYYEIKLYFNELYFASNYARIFDIYIQKQLIYSNFDIYTIANGQYTVVVLHTIIRFDQLRNQIHNSTYQDYYNNNYNKMILDIDFVPIKNNIKLNAIEINMLSYDDENNLYNDIFNDVDHTDYYYKSTTASNILSTYVSLIQPPTSLLFHPIIDTLIDGYGYDNGFTIPSNTDNNNISTINSNVQTISQPIYINAGGNKVDTIVPFVASNSTKYNYNSNMNQIYDPTESSHYWIDDTQYMRPDMDIGQTFSICPQSISNITSYIDVNNEVSCSERYFGGIGVYDIPLLRTLATNDINDIRIPTSNNNTVFNIHYILHFAELWLDFSGVRVFNVVIENQMVAYQLDIYNITKERYTSYSISGNATVTDQSLTIELIPIIGYAKINAIEIHPM